MAGRRISDLTAIAAADLASDDLFLVRDVSAAAGAGESKKITRAELTLSAIPNGDKGDITTSADGATWTIDNDVVTYAKMQNVSAQYRLLGRSTAGAGDPEEITSSANVFSILGAADYAAVRTLLSLVPGTDVQAYDADLSTIAGLAKTDGNFIVGDGAAWVVESGATVRASLGLSIGTDVQAYDAELAALAGLTSAADKAPYFTGSGTAALADFTAAGRAIAGAASALAQAALLIPIGSVTSFAGSSAPTGWLLCYGQAISRTTYSALFAIVSTTYGVGDGSTTFNLPDCRGRVVAGKDNMGGSAASRLTNSGTGNPGIDGSTLGAAGGVDRYTLTAAQLAAHSHTASSDSQGNHTHTEVTFDATAGAGYPRDYQVSGLAYSATGNYATNTGAAGTHSHNITVNSTAAGVAHPITQPTIVFNTIIFAGV